MQDMQTFCPFEDLVFLIAAILDKKKISVMVSWTKILLKDYNPKTYNPANFDLKWSNDFKTVDRDVKLRSMDSDRYQLLN